MRPAVLLCLAVAVVSTGCPRPDSTRFRSADPRGGGWFSNFPPFLDAVAGRDDEATGEDAVPERELVEPDIIRQAGHLLYILNQYRGLTIVDLDTETIVAQVATPGLPRDLYLAGDRAYVIVGYATDYAAEGDTIQFDVQSRLHVVDISNPSEAVVLSAFDLEGDVVDSRLVGDVLYAVTAAYQWYWAEPGWLKQNLGQSWITSVHVGDSGNVYQADVLEIPTAGSVIHATPEAIFVAAPDGNGTRITFVDIADPNGVLAVRGHVAIRGHVADRFKMDVYEGVLRVVSNGWDGQRQTYVSTVDLANPDALVKLAETAIEGAIDETLFATRFDGPRAYIVTFLVIDPLFVVDLSNPAAPRVEGVLEVPGWSTHIEPMGDRLLALGVDDTDGRRVSLSLFDVANPAAPALLDRVAFGSDWSWSSAYDDVKALTVLDDAVLVPFSGWHDRSGGYDRLQFVSYSRDGLEVRGHVDLQGTILRSLAHDGSYYGVTSEELARIVATDLDAPELASRVTLAENVAAFVALSDSLGAEVVYQAATGQTSVKPVGLPLKNDTSTAQVDIGTLQDAHAYGTSVVLVGASWEASPHYRVALVDCSTPSAPSVAAAFTVDVEPYFGGWWPLPYEPVVDIAVRPGSPGSVDGSAGLGKTSLWAPWWTPAPSEPTTFVLGDALVLRCHGSGFPSRIGPGISQEGLAIVNLAEPGWTGIVGLGFGSVDTVQAADGRLYVGSFDNATGLGDVRAMVAYYLSELTVSPEGTVSAGPRANVPGRFVQYDRAAGVLVLRDFQWTLTGDFAGALKSTSWDGGTTATLIDSLALPAFATGVHGRGSRVYVETYDTGYRLETVHVGAGGGLSSGGSVAVTDQWASLLDAQGATAYVSVGGNAIAIYDFSGPGSLQTLVPVMATPVRIEFGAAQAYAALGYAGLVPLPL